MEPFEPVPDGDESGARWQGDADTFDRVYDVVLGTSTLTPYVELADIAGCSPTAAKKHLDRLVDIGIARSDTDAQPARYARDEGYLEWQEARQIATELTQTEIRERVAALEAECETYEERFGETDPKAVSLVDADDHESTHERLVALGNWQAARRDIRLYELGHRLAQNDGTLLSA